MRIPNYIKEFIKIYLFGIIFFTFFRVLLLLANTDQLSTVPDSERIKIMLQAFFMGFRFDTVISGYILLFPVLLAGVSSFINSNLKGLRIFWLYLTGILYTLAFSICSSDIPYFNHFYNRINTSVFLWNDTPTWVFSMIFEEPSYLFYVIVFIITSIVFWYFFKKLFINKELILESEEKNRAKFLTVRSLYFIIFVSAIFIAIRGRIEEKSPIRVGTAFFSAYAFPNQLGLNPVFTFIRSYLDDLNKKDKELNLMDSERAIKTAQNYFGIDTTAINPIPIYRKIRSEKEPLRANVIVVIMESMSANKMKRFGNKKDLTPNLDSIANMGYSFNNFYSAGIHTYCGVYSTLFAYPILFKYHPMKGAYIPKYTGLPVTLSEKGYETYYFTTHDDQFDNIGGFLRNNGVKHVFSEDDYPSEWIESTLGVPDHILFEQVVKELNKRENKDKPFFAAIMTASDHGPYVIPENVGFEANYSDIHDKIVEYADWSIGEFFKEAKKQDWFENTIFVFVADHGARLNPVYDMPLSFNHSPFIIYSSKYIEGHKDFNQFGTQIDVFPTIMGMLGEDYDNLTFGIDLFKEQRPFAYFCSDDKVGVINNDYFYVYNRDGREALYKYRNKDITNFINENRTLADEMKRYAFSMMQTANYMIVRRMTGN